MTIADLLQQGKGRVRQIPSHIWVVLIILSSTTCAFGLGIVAERELNNAGQGSLQSQSTDRLWIEQLATTTLPGGGPAAASAATKTHTVPQTPDATPAVPMTYVASKNGTKYYLPTCSGANRIKEENKIWFRTKEEAAARGLTPASNCKGL